MPYYFYILIMISLLIFSVIFYQKLRRKRTLDETHESYTVPVFQEGVDPIENRLEIRYIAKPGKERNKV